MVSFLKTVLRHSLFGFLAIYHAYALESFSKEDIKQASLWAYAVYQKTPEMVDLVKNSSQFYERSNDQVMNIGWLLKVDSFDTKKVMLVFLGSDNFKDFLINIDGRLSADPFFKEGNIHSGFLKSFSSIQDKILITLKAYCEQHALQLEELDITLVGHSLGGAAAILAASFFKTTTETKRVQIKVITFAAPRVGDQAFMTSYEKSILKNDQLNFCRIGDLVPFLPLGSKDFVVNQGGYVQISTTKDFKKTQSYFKKLAGINTARGLTFQETFALPAIFESHSMKNYDVLIQEALEKKDTPLLISLKESSYIPENDDAISQNTSLEGQDEYWEKLYTKSGLDFYDYYFLYDFYDLTFENFLSMPFSWFTGFLVKLLDIVLNILKGVFFAFLVIILLKYLKPLSLELSPVRHKKQLNYLWATLSLTLKKIITARALLAVLSLFVFGGIFKMVFDDNWQILTASTFLLSFIPIVGFLFSFLICCFFSLVYLKTNLIFLLLFFVYAIFILLEIVALKSYVIKQKSKTEGLLLIFLMLIFMKYAGIAGFSFFYIVFPFLKNFLHWATFDPTPKTLKPLSSL
ncbi:MAG TPA: hypothetical protein VI959_01935 [Alphaproteobacteria bacterium]|nr:hypothetical protein [Alphaproteobacteria bacterium]